MQIINVPVSIHQILKNPNQSIQASIIKSRCHHSNGLPDLQGFLDIVLKHGFIAAVKQYFFIKDIEKDAQSFEQALKNCGEQQKSIEFCFNGEKFRLIDESHSEHGFFLGDEPLNTLNSMYIERVTDKPRQNADILFVYEGCKVSDYVRLAKNGPSQPA